MFVRIRSETDGGAWCPMKPVSKSNIEYLQIDLGGLKVITLIETQGRFGQGQVRKTIVSTYVNRRNNGWLLVIRRLL
jgi:hypothetical protein